MVPTPAELTYFLEIAITENISRASERLGISQPTLSVAIKRMEDSLGAPLLIRNSTGVKLTKAGQRFQSRARVLLDQWQNVVHEIKREESEIAGCYKIGAHASVACGPLAEALPKILYDFTSLEIHMYHDLSRRVTERVINFDLDFGIVVNPIAHSDLVIRKIYTDDVRFYGVKDIISTQTKGLLLCYDPDLSQSQVLLKLARQANISFKRFFISSSLEVIAKVASLGAGIAILPHLVARAHPHLFPLWQEIPSLQDIHALVYRRDAQSSPASKALAKALEHHLSLNN